MKKNLFCLGAAFACCFVVFEMFLRLNHFKPYHRTEPGRYKNESVSGGWFEVNQELGWVFNRKTPIHQQNALTNQVNTKMANKDGFLDAKWNDFKSADSREKILVFGDSFAAGHGVLEEERFSDLLNSKLGENHVVYNFAVPGWGFDQIYLAFLKFVPIAKPDIVIVSYINNDLLRSLEAYRTVEKIEKPSFEIKKKTLRLREAKENPVAEFLLHHIQTANFFYKTFGKPYLAKRLAEKMAAEMIQSAEKNGIALIFVKIPRREAVVPLRNAGDWVERTQRSLYDHVFGLSSFLNERAQIYIDLKEPIREMMAGSSVDLYLKNDPHINADGHRVIADILFEKIKQLDRSQRKSATSSVSPNIRPPNGKHANGSKRLITPALEPHR